MHNIFKNYLNLPRPVVLLISGNLLLYIVNGAFMLILNIYMSKIGYPDDEIARYTAYRYLGVLILTVPFGLFIKGRALKPYFIFASVIFPLSSIITIRALHMGNEIFAITGFIFWGIGLMFIQVTSIPFIMRTADEDVLSESVTLSWTSWSLAMIIAGLLISLLSALGSFTLGNIHFVWDEYHILLFIALISSTPILVFLKIPEAKPKSEKIALVPRLKGMFHGYNWSRLSIITIPSLLIAIGAGLTIPFINLFFYSVFDVDSQQFSMIGSATAVIVVFANLLVPVIQRRFGFYVSIIFTQVLAIFFLVALAMTELYATWEGAIFVAIGAYMLRTPLMNMAGPSTTEMSMKFVGKASQELNSAINSSIWSASWFISAKIFQYLRGIDVPYYKIFIITAIMYSLAVAVTFFVIRKFNHEMKLENETSGSSLDLKSQFIK